jgi:transcriptional regulator with XRE-family HTH domain
MDELTGRIKGLMETHALGPTQLADRVGVNRAAISHVLSGRNRPSLDLVLKLLEAFPDLTADGLLFGRAKAPDETTAPESKVSIKAAISKPRPNDNALVKVLLLYADGKVEEFRP